MNQGVRAVQAWASERRERLTPLEMAVKALGARFPVLVAARIGAACADVPTAVAALRQREPHLFEPTGEPTAGRPLVSPVVRPYSGSLATP